MTNDNAIVRLLYAILSQKCLKDIDWNKVAHDPVLQQEITNGHAARMRYSRFKKQMDGTAGPSGVRKPRAPSTPRKPKAEKTKSPKTKKEPRQSGDNGGDGKIKAEVGAEVGSSQESEEVGGSQEESSLQHSPVVKMEAGGHGNGHGNGHGHGYLTPMGSQSQTPSPGFGGSMSEMDEMMASFNMPSQHHAMTGDPQAMFQGAMVEGSQHGYGMGMGMHMGDPFEGLWHQSHQEEGEAGVLVKTEPRWDDTYRQV